jgi:hypothetical protein
MDRKTMDALLSKNRFAALIRLDLVTILVKKETIVRLSTQNRWVRISGTVATQLSGKIPQRTPQMQKVLG